MSGNTSNESVRRARALEGKVAIVTGASAGIGEAVALSLASAGAKVVINGRDKKRLEDVKRRIESVGSSATIHIGDVRLEKTHSELVELAIREYGRVNIAVNNAGVYSFGPFEEVTGQQVDNMVDINIKGIIYALKHQLPAIGRYSSESDWGSVINVSTGGTKSTSDTVEMGSLVYSVTKAAVDQLTFLGASAGKKHHVRVNAVAPGPIFTPGVASLGVPTEADAQKLGVGMTLLGRLGRLDEVTAAVDFLAGPLASFITGDVLAVDGGMRVK